MKIRFLGTGSGVPDPDRMTSAILIEGSDGGLLIDAGEGSARRLRESGTWAQEIATILLTHAHGDHVSGLPMLFMGWDAEKRTRAIEILAPGGLDKAALAWLKALRLGTERLTFDVLIRELVEGELETASGHRIEAWRNGHISADDSGGGSFSVAVLLDEGRWVFSSDLPRLDALAGRIAGAAGLVVEATHVDPRAAVELARREGAGRIYLTHIQPGQSCLQIENAIWARDNLLLEG